MLCLVTQPNSVVLEVQLDSKSNGQECLEKVGTVSVTGLASGGLAGDTSSGLRPGWGCVGLGVGFLSS